MKSKIVLIFMILLPGWIQAQQVTRQLTKTPDVAALAKYIDYPVSYATGVPDISIPLYTIKTKEFTLPITLSYHASGIKVTDLSGFVGLGWTLNTIPTITRTVRGNYDEESNGYIANSMLGTDTKEYTINVAQGIWDEQPDLFYYSLLDKSGKFMFYKSNLQSTNATPIPMPYEPIQISLNSMTQFTIVDDNGAIYTFNKGETTGYGTPHTNSWNVSKILAPQKNDSLLFSYYTFDNDYNLPEFGDKVLVEDNYTNTGIINSILSEQMGGDDVQIYYVDPWGKFNTCGSEDCTKQYSPYGGDLSSSRPYSSINSTYIKQIVLPDGKTIIFNATINSTSKLLSSITTPDGKTIHFYYGSFPERTEGILVRARLDSIVFSDVQNNAVERYKFSYIEGNSYGIPYPGLDDWRSSDSWGYYNGVTLGSNQCNVPQQQITVKTGYPNPFSFTIGTKNINDANENSMKLWTLNEIDYPTGGKATFDYETNRYIQNDTLKLTGGLRVKMIQNYDPVTQQTIIRNFSYDNPVYFPLTKSDFTYEQQKAIGTTSVEYSRLRTYLSSPFVAYAFNGSPIVYNKVTETRGDGAVTEYYFDYNAGSLPYHISGTSLVMDNQNDWRYGDKIAEIEYAMKSNSLVPVKRKDYTYKMFLTGKYVYNRQYYRNTLISPLSGETSSNNNVSINMPDNNILQGAKRLSEEIETTYGSNANQTVTRKYSYGNLNHLYPTRETTINSQNDSIWSIKQYAGDLDATLSKMNILSPLLEQTDYDKGTLSEGKYTVYGSFSNLWLPGIEKKWNPMTSVWEAKYYYDSYDSNGNILQGHKANDYTSAVIWDYSTHLPVIIADNTTNATLQNAVQNALPAGYNTLLQLLTAIDGIATNGGEQNLWATFCQEVINNSQLTHASITFYTYKPYIGMTSSTDSKGTATYYEYDSYNRLKNMRNVQGQLLKRENYHYVGTN